MDWKLSDLSGRCFAISHKPADVWEPGLLQSVLKVGGLKGKAKGGAESQPSCIPPADAL